MHTLELGWEQGQLEEMECDAYFLAGEEVFLLGDSGRVGKVSLVPTGYFQLYPEVNSQPHGASKCFWCPKVHCGCHILCEVYP